MTVKTYYATNVAAVTPNWFSILQDGGSAPAAAQASYGYSTRQLAPPAFIKSLLATSGASTSGAPTSYIDSATGPNAGTSTGATADSFMTPNPLTGLFAAGVWQLSLGFRYTNLAVTGQIRCRIWASASPTGKPARELTSGALVWSVIAMTVATTTYATIFNWNAPAVALNNEYLFFQVEWAITVAGTSTGNQILYWVGTVSSFITTDLGPLPPAGGLTAMMA